MAIDVSARATQIRTAIKGKEVRENLAGGIEDIANDLNSYEENLSSDNDDFKATITAEEKEHSDAEAIRVTAENTRISAETTRQNNEQTRQTNETTRVSNEQTRQSNWEQMQHVDANAELVAARQGQTTLLANLEQKDNKIGNLTTLNTTAKDSVVNAINENTSQLADNASYYLNLKDYGVYEDGTTDNATVFANAIIAAKASGKTIRLKPITYAVSSLTIDGAKMDLNGAILKVSSDIIVENDGILENGTIDGGGIISQNGKQNIRYMVIKNFTTFFLKLSTGAYENIIDFIRVQNNTSSSSTSGLIVNASDNYIGHIYGYGCFTGIEIQNGSDNYFSNIHLWLNSNNLFTGSTFIHVQNGGSGNFFDSCCPDTYNNIFKFDSANLFISATNFFVIHNVTLFPNQTINFININNTSLKGDCTIKGTNWVTGNVIFASPYYSSVKFSFIDYTALPVILDQTSLNAKLTGVGSCSNASKIKINGDKIICDMTIFFTSEKDLTNTSFTLDISNMLNVKGFYADGYGICIGDQNVLTIVFYTLSNGIITIQKIPSILCKIWSLNLKFVGTLDNYIN